MAFLNRVFHDLLGFRREADDEAGAPILRLRERTQDIRILGQFERGWPTAFLLQFLGGSSRNPPIGNRSGANRNLGRQCSLASGQHIGGGFHMNDTDPGGVRQCDRARNQGRFRAESRKRLGNRVALLTGGMVRQIAHRIDGFARRPACHQGAATRKRAGAWTGKMIFNGLNNSHRLRHAPKPVFTARHVPRIGPDTNQAARFQCRDVGLRGGMLPHPDVHRRREHDRFVRGQQHRRRQIVREPTRHPRHNIGACGRHNQ